MYTLYWLLLLLFDKEHRRKVIIQTRILLTIMMLVGLWQGITAGDWKTFTGAAVILGIMFGFSLILRPLLKVLYYAAYALVLITLGPFLLAAQLIANALDKGRPRPPE